MALAVYYASADVDQHVAELRRLSRYRLACYPQRSLSPGRRDRARGVLWELTSGRPPSRQRLATAAAGRPLVSYSVSAARDLADLSRSLGFVSHLRAPLRPLDVEHRLALAAGGDLAARLRQFQPTLRRHLNRVDMLAAMVRAANATLDPARVADLILARAASWMPVPGIGLVTIDLSGRADLVTGRGVDAGLERACHVLGTLALRQGEVCATARLGADRRLAIDRAEAAVAVPLLCRGRVAGALVGIDRLPSSRPPRLAPATVTALQTMFEPAMIALEHARRVQRAEALSVTDDLTQLHNSRYLGQALRRETKRASRSGRPLSLLFVDLDGFKSVNDAHGHLCGGRALIEAGEVIRDSARETDVAARFGGDEFALVLPDTGSEGAVAVAARVRERIAAHRFLAREGLDIRLTASVGVATLPDVAASVEALIQAADQAMYWVKDHGKDGIHVAE